MPATTNNIPSCIFFFSDRGELSDSEDQPKINQNQQTRPTEQTAKLKTNQIDRSTLPSKINLLDQPFHPTIQIQPQRYYTQALTESNQPFYSTISIQPKSTLLFYYQIGPV
ncbi:hypothetical protein H4Q26_012675 [Puccinia striiformis f. sp. tritici PST-130]|nr:hypothetical protein H4Q26_012675 [Puccinia striiformis f. sp. tritici PST-130]